MLLGITLLVPEVVRVFTREHLVHFEEGARLSPRRACRRPLLPARVGEREFFIDNLLVRIPFIIEMI